MFYLLTCLCTKVSKNIVLVVFEEIRIEKPQLISQLFWNKEKHTLKLSN